MIHSAIRISTGAKVPEGFDTVVPVELVEVDGDRLKILEVRKKGLHIRLAGEEFRAGDELLARGTVITPAETAHRSISAGLLCEIAMLTGQKLKWNPKKEKFIDNKMADRLLRRPFRTPWTLENN